MLTLLLGTDWVANRNEILSRIALQVSAKNIKSILIVPELISHDMERRLCRAAGDTCSRFAEVLTFTRLASRVADAAGNGALECLDNGGRIVAMASAARQLRSKLKAYASVETNPEFLTGLIDAVDEFKRCCISAEDLRTASQKAEGSFSQKLEELSLLLESYDALCSRGKRDPRDQMTWVLEQLEDSTFGKEHIFFVDGFPDFTRQHMAVLQHLIETSQHVVVSLTCDKLNSEELAFEKAGQTAMDFIRAAQAAGTEYEIVSIEPEMSYMHPVASSLFQGTLSVTENTKSHLSVLKTDSVYRECSAVAEKIQDYIRNGNRFRDISVVCSDMEPYRNILPTVFSQCNIPCYISGTEGILEKPVIATVLSALDAVLGGLEQKSIFEYMKSMLSPLELDQCDKLENYAILWNISGNKWLSEFKNNPYGLKEQWKDEAISELKLINETRESVILPLFELCRGFDRATCLKDQISSVYDFLERIQLSERLTEMAKLMDESGDNRSAQILNQLWEILISALEQLYDVLGDTKWDSETFTRLLKLLLSQYNVGTIPPVLDTVTVGPVSAMRCQQAKHVFILGAVEGALPGYAGSGGILTDQERVTLRNMGVPLTGGSVDGLQAEFAEIYGVVCGARETLHVSYVAGQPSFIYNRLLCMAGQEDIYQEIYGPTLYNERKAAAYLVRMNAETAAIQLHISDLYADMQARKNYNLGKIKKSTIEKVYGSCLNLSASQIDLQEECRFAYFLKYGMRARERKPITVDPAEFGTYVHAVLEKTGKKVMDAGGFHHITLEEVQAIASKFSDEYAKERFSEIDSSRLSYLFRRNTQELMMVVEELWKEMQDSKFYPIDFEVGFGDHEDLSAIPIPAKSMEAQLRGFVDRVDVWKENGQNYFRVVDYKTGKKDFDYCDVFNGIGLQMLLYLYALESAGSSLLGENPIPAGVQYFPARAPYVSADGVLKPEEALSSREKLWKRKGLLLQDEQVLEAMEPGEEPVRLSYTRRKDGSISGDLADRSQIKKLKTYIFHILENMIEDIASGNVEANPYTRGSNSACNYCPYDAVCHSDDLPGRRDYKAMTADRFWEEIDKEVKKING